MLVADLPSIVGKTIEAAGLRHLPGLYLMEIERDGHVIPAVGSETRLEAGDRLIFVGVVESIVDLQKIAGLSPATEQVFKLDSPRSDRCLIEAVVSDSFPHQNQSIRESRFRARYNAAVIAVARNGERINSKIGDIKLLPGDTLLLETHETFLEVQRNSRDFFLVSRVEGFTPPRHETRLVFATSAFRNGGRRGDGDGFDAQRFARCGGADGPVRLLSRDRGSSIDRLAGSVSDRSGSGNRRSDDLQRNGCVPFELTDQVGRNESACHSRNHLRNRNGVDQPDHRQSRCCVVPANRIHHRHRSECGPGSPVGRYHDLRRRELRDTDRISNQSDGDGPGRLPLLRLPETRRPTQPDRVDPERADYPTRVAVSPIVG